MVVAAGEQGGLGPKACHCPPERCESRSSLGQQLAICGGSLSLGILLICPASRDNFFPVAQRQVSALAEGSKGPALLPLQPQSASLAALLGTPASRAAPSCHNAVGVCGL